MALLEKLRKTLDSKIRSYYYICGDGYLVKDFIEKLSLKMFPSAAPESRSVHRYDFGSSKDECPPVSSVLEEAGMQSMFADAKLLVLENVHKMKDEDAAKLCAFLSKVPDATCFVLVSPEPPKQDKRKKEPNPFLALDDIINLAPAESDIMAWAGEFLRTEGKEIDEDLLKFIIDESGADMFFISNELEKMVLLSGDKKKIDKENYRKIKAGDKAFTTLDLKEAFVYGKRKELFLMFDQVYEDSEPEAIFGLIFNTIKTVYEYIFYSNKGQKERFGKRGFFLEREKKLFVKIPYVEILKILKDTDKRIKLSNRKAAKTHLTMMFDAVLALMGK